MTESAEAQLDLSGRRAHMGRISRPFTASPEHQDHVVCKDIGGPASSTYLHRASYAPSALLRADQFADHSKPTDIHARIIV
jgi:hypothetical protein